VRQRNRRVRGCGRVGNLDERKTALAADVLHFAVADGSQIGFSTRLSPLPRAIIPLVASVRKQVRAKPRRGLTEEFSVRIRTYRESSSGQLRLLSLFRCPPLFPDLCLKVSRD